MPTSKERLVSTNELAKHLGMSVATVNYYTNMGLFTIHDRKGNKRLYDKVEMEVVFRKVHELRKEGYSLRLIQQRFEKGYRL